MSEPEHSTSRPHAAGTVVGVTPVVVDPSTSAADATTGIDRAFAAIGEVSMPAVDRSGCSWPLDWRGEGGDALLTQMLRGVPVRPGSLARWRVLNPEDRPLCPDECREFEALVQAVNTELQNVVHQWSDVALDERIQSIEQGVVPAFFMDPNTPEGAKALDRAVEAYLATMLRAGQQVSADQARAILRDNIPPPLTECFIQHGGKHYLLRDFGELPRSSSVFEGLKFAITQAVLGYQAWFEAHGFKVDDAALNALLARLVGTSMREIY